MKKVWKGFTSVLNSALDILVKKPFIGFVNFLNNAFNTAIKNPWKKFVTSLKPKYAVVFTMYHVIPGAPVQRKSTRHDFGKGELIEARSFYEKVVNKTNQVRLAPTEIHLVKGKKKVIQKKHFGPINEVKQQLKMSA